MKDLEKSKEQLISELAELRQQVTNLRERSHQLEKAQQLLGESNQKYRLLVKNAPAGIYEIDFVKHKFVSVNDVMCEFTGYTKEELLSMNPFDILTEESKLHFSERLRRAFSGKRVSESTEFKVLGKDGREYCAIINAKYKYKNGIPVGATVVAHDITGRKKMEKALLESEERYRRIVETANEGIWIIDNNNRVAFANDKMAELLGYARDELLGKELFYFLDEEEQDFVKESLQRRRQGISEQLDLKHRRKDGTYLWAIVSSAPIFDSAGQYKGALSMITDITGHKQVEEDLRLSEDRYRKLVELSPYVIAVHSEGKINFINKIGARLYGVENPEDLIGKPVLDFIHPDYRNIVLQDCKKQSVFEGNILLRDGTSLYGETADTLINYDGKPAKMVVARDVTARKKTEQALRDSEERYRLIVETASEGIAIIDSENRVAFVNETVLRMFGYSKEKILGRPFDDILNDEGKALVLLSLQRCRQGVHEKFDIKLLHEDGSYIYAMVCVSQIYNDEHQYIGSLAMFTDITARKKAEEALRLSEEKFQKVFNASPALLVLTTLDGKYIDVNENFLETTGYSRAEVLGRTAVELGLYVDPDTRNRGLPEFNKNQNIRNQEVSYRMKSGEIRTGMSSEELIELNGEKCILAVVIDITEKKQLEMEMSRLERLHLIGEMAAGIGHEIRNPMTAVRGFLQLLQEKNECIRHKEYFDLMIDELDRANSIITEFLSLAKNKPVELRTENLNKILNALSPLITADAFKENIDVIFELQEIPDLTLSEKEMRQLILNLVRNGLESMEQGGKITVRTAVENDEVVLSVQDYGNGIKPDILEKIGTPFFTTKENGTGLGLAVCYGIASRHNAAIKVETGPMGTTFLVRFKKLCVNHYKQNF